MYMIISTIDNDQFFDSTGGLRGFKRSLYEGGIRVPMIVVLFFSIIWYMTRDGLVTFHQALYPILLGPFGISYQLLLIWLVRILILRLMVSVQFLPYCMFLMDMILMYSGKEQEPKDYLYWEFCTDNKWGNALRRREWKVCC